MTEHPHLHASHPDVIKRLKRAEGHLRSVVQMIEAGRPCLDVAQQLHAVEKAVAQAKRTLIQDHLDHCLDDVAAPLDGARRQVLTDFKAIAKYL
ncbi:metal-sensing transcriptional repressor [Tistrella mobilis]|jgi:DNA-binding FrmR family transcriptional regulator|uniref:metal-sensing transcriptional repressor n=1 Tax=Tistrella mobilis TaxID=171437 RepID=UPI0035569D52